MTQVVQDDEPTAEGVAKELTDIRRRGLREIDLTTSRQAPIRAAALEQMAQLTIPEGQRPEPGRPALLGQFLDQALTAFAESGAIAQASFIRPLFFDSTTRGRRPGDLLAQSRKITGLGEDAFDQRRQAYFYEFAKFVIESYFPKEAVQPESIAEVPPGAENASESASESSLARVRTVNKRSAQILAALAAVGAVVLTVIIASTVRGGDDGDQSTNSPSAISSPGSTSGRSSGSERVMAQPTLMFDSLGGSGSQFIQVYAGSGTAPEDKRVTGTFQHGQTTLVTCKALGRMVVSDSGLGEEPRSSDVWIRLSSAPGIIQYATLTYAAIDPQIIEDLPTCS